MSHVHFTANPIYRKKVIQLGENPKNVHVVFGIDSLKKTKLLSKKELEKKFNFKFKRRIL